MKHTVANIHNQRLHHYLQSLHWASTHIQNNELERILAASCLRYLGGLEDISFVLELCYEIQSKYTKTMSISLRYATKQLSDLSDKLRKHQMQYTELQTIRESIHTVQEMITGINYPME